MRVLATFPEVVGPPQPAGARCPAPSVDAEAEIRRIEASAASPRAGRPRGRPIRIAPRPRFPLASLAALGLVTAVLWMLVAIRERAPRDRPETREQLAAEPGTETMR